MVGAAAWRKGIVLADVVGSLDGGARGHLDEVGGRGCGELHAQPAVAEGTTWAADPEEIHLESPGRGDEPSVEVGLFR